MQKNIGLFFIGAVLVLGALVLVRANSGDSTLVTTSPGQSASPAALASSPAPEIHFHAGFQVYVDGVKQDYSDFQYMHLKPCDEDEEHAPTDPAQLTEAERAEEQQERAHLHEGIGDVVHVHRENVVWGDLFQNLGVTLPAGKTVVGYIGDQRVTDIMKQPISANESIVIVVGDQSKVASMLKDRVTVAHIQEVEKLSESCGSGK